MRILDPSPADAKAAIKACGSDEMRAKRVLDLIREGPNFTVDVEAGMKGGRLTP